MEEENVQRERSKGFLKASMQEEGHEDSVKQEMSGDSSDESSIDTMREDPIPIDS